jgi:hypothetical protein
MNVQIDHDDENENGKRHAYNLPKRAAAWDTAMVGAVNGRSSGALWPFVHR